MASISATWIRRYVELRKGQQASNAESARELAALKPALPLGLRTGKRLVRPHIPTVAVGGIPVESPTGPLGNVLHLLSYAR